MEDKGLRVNMDKTKIWVCLLDGRLVLSSRYNRTVLAGRAFQNYARKVWNNGAV